MLLHDGRDERAELRVDGVRESDLPRDDTRAPALELFHEQEWRDDHHERTEQDDENGYDGRHERLHS